MALRSSLNAPARQSRCPTCKPRVARGRTAIVFAKLRLATEPHIQLGTAKLPNDINKAAFSEYLYQWAATLTQSGANFPFVLPVKADKYSEGFKISLLKRTPAGNFDSAGEIQGTVEELAGKGPVVMVRFFEGPAGLVDRRTAPPSDAQERLSLVLDSLVDVATIMSSLPDVLRKGVAQCR
ncbi:hypothetical protein PLESTB_000445700 [Pleodorina starrii]|uniref:DUF7148 domain-containing protein n=1 Tax=Pleodorina starrii TaxID=330485 RepID=A0A9W6F032_9CHLO|nr:hypothetical protein PLESTM_000675100 [Pleodorina starrii]GLC50910.1 hypothetical protein PLESTB_000445700 [Pleodorina starrii]GLC73897.1 hypothetical protein PLESTF_001435000 [Pleodorina starrii]